MNVTNPLMWITDSSYTRQVINEVLRLTLIGNTTVRIPDEDTQLAGFTIPAKVTSMSRGGMLIFYHCIVCSSSIHPKQSGKTWEILDLTYILFRGKLDR